ncbi:MAG: chemotaxis protein CheW [Deltaproteobacteria bacterium]
MSGKTKVDPMLEIFISETLQQIEQLEQAVLNIEKSSELSDAINEIFRLMHSIKGASAMMLFNNISTLAHSIEDLFDFIRKNLDKEFDYPQITDIVLDSIDFIKNEVIKIQNGSVVDGDSSERAGFIKDYLASLKTDSTAASMEKEDNNTKEQQKFYIGSDKSSVVEQNRNSYETVVFFERDCSMENVRAFVLINDLNEIAEDIKYYPEDITESEQSVKIIRGEGFRVRFKTQKTEEEVRALIANTGYLRDFTLEKLEKKAKGKTEKKAKKTKAADEKKSKKVIVLDEEEKANSIKKEQPELQNEVQEKKVEIPKALVKDIPLIEKQESINVNILKLDKLMDLVGELVISEAMVTRNPDIEGLELENFNKAARQLRKITNDLQDVVTSIRMVPLALTFQKMNRLVRDMGRQLKKEVELEILGETTEVDKNIIEHLSDPLMHIIRNSLDHGLEIPEERVAKGKLSKGKIVLEGKNAGGDVWIVVRDDGRGLDKNKILAKAKERKLLTKPENELTDKEIYSFIFLPGFSTKESVTEFSGRGVGMDVVMKNIEKIRGSVIVDSTVDVGTTISIKIPLTLAIINGMTVKVGQSTYTVPTISIKESFRINNEELVIDPDGNEMVLVRGECYPVVRLNQLYKVPTDVQQIDEGIIMMIENESKSICLFADSLIGEQQVVVKALPKYVKKVRGIAGCTLLGDGSISLILDAGELIN